MEKFDTVVAVAGVVGLVILVGAIVFWWLITRNGQNPFL